MRNPGEIFRASPNIGPINPSIALNGPMGAKRGLMFGIQNQTLNTANPLKFETGIIVLGPLTLGLRIRRGY